MKSYNRAIPAFAVALTLGLLAALLWPLATRSSHAAAANVQYYVGPTGSDANGGTSASAPFKTIQKAVDLAQPGDVVNLAAGVYLQDIVSRRSGSADAPITIAGPADAVLKGGGKARIVEINHDNITLNGFTIDGLWGAPDSADGYRDKLLYALGKAPLDGVSGLKALNMTFRNAGGECVRLRYFAQHNEIASSTFQGCGVHDFKFGAGGKNGEGVYIGTAPEQLGDGKNPTADPDQSSGNWIHDNTFNTQGNECVDIKEASAANLVEHNRCTGQSDPNSGGFDARGNGNIFRYNESYGNAGAGVRLGGDTATAGIDNEVYANNLHDNRAGGIAFQKAPQRTICGNAMSGNTGGDAVGSYGSQFNPTAACSATPPSTPTPAPPADTPAPTPLAGAPAPMRPPACTDAYGVDGNVASFIEAEQYSSLGGRFTDVADSARSGGAFMQIPGSGMHKDPATLLRFDLNITNGGSFYVWVLGFGRDGSSDSFFLQVDNGSLVTATLVQGKWGWKRAGNKLTLGSGPHSLSVKDREDGASIDKIVLTRDGNFVPSGLGADALAPCR